MGNLCVLISCFLLMASAVAAQTAQTQIERALPQWLTGIIALSGFLFLVFVSFLVKKAWCEDPNRRKTSVRGDELVMGRTPDTRMDSIRSKEDSNTYDTRLDCVRSKADSNTYDTRLDCVRSKEDSNAYNNMVFDTNVDEVMNM